VILRIAGIDLATRPMERGDRAFVGSHWTEQMPRDVTDALMDGCRVVVWCSAALQTTLHGFVALAGRTLVDAYVMPHMRRRGLMTAAVREALGDEPARTGRLRWNERPSGKRAA
jgi:hypothetical protein